MPYPNALAGLFGLPDNNAQPDTSGGLFGAARRQVTGLLSDPVGNAKQTLGLLGQQISRQNALMDAAFSDRTNPLQITNRNALAEAANNMLTGPLGFAPAGMTVWHGSPHTFDKFDSSKIGTGEGAQAYGHGLYVAESPKVADQYRVNLTPQTGGRAVTSDETMQPWYQLFHGKYGSKVTGQYGVVYPSADSVLKEISAGRASQFPSDLVEALKPRLNPGSLYKVDLPDEHIAKMLDWDKPLSAQSPAVQKALSDYSALSGVPFSPAMSGKDIYNAFTARAAKAKGYTPSEYGKASRDAAEEARWAGIPGIRYLDQGSRGVGSGTSNYVVFPGNEGLLTMLERNGVPVR